MGKYFKWILVILGGIFIYYKFVKKVAPKDMVNQIKNDIGKMRQGSDTSVPQAEAEGVTKVMDAQGRVIHASQKAGYNKNTAEGK